MSILLYNIFTKVNKTNTMMTFRKQPKKKNYFVPILIIVGIVIILFVVLWLLGSSRNPTKTPSSANQSSPTITGTKTSTSGSASVDTTPTISANGNTATNTKANIASSGSTGSTTSVAITSVDQTHADVTNISAYVSTVVSTGTCQFTFTNDAVSFYKDTSTSPSASTSSCATLTLHNSDFPSPGTWQLVVSFSSGTISGSSTQTSVVVK
jgi:hypothetical protein